MAGIGSRFALPAYSTSLWMRAIPSSTSSVTSCALKYSTRPGAVLPTASSISFIWLFSQPSPRISTPPAFG